MPSKNPAQRLEDIRDNIAAIRHFVRGLSFEDYQNDQKTIYAVTRALEIISEAAKRLPEEVKERHPSIDWPAIAAVGNIYRHEYDVVDESLVWHTIHRDLTPLEQAVNAELQRQDW